MSTLYKIVKGDTFEKVARKEYGTVDGAGTIARANPGSMEPLIEGSWLLVPELPDAPVIAPQGSPANNENEVILSIGGERFRFWDSVTIARAIDSFDSIEFSAPFEPGNSRFREVFQPLSYQPIGVTVGGEPLFTGTMLTPTPSSTPESRTISVNGYSLPGVLNDCTMPASAFPLEFNGQNLKDIARAMVEPFGLSVEFSADPGPVFERVACEPEKKVLEFLADLARQRGFIVSSTPRGKLLFQKSVATGSPVVRLSEGVSPLVSVSPEFRSQEYYSHVTGLLPAGAGVKGGQYTVTNPRLQSAVRPFIFKADDTKAAEAKSAVEAKAARMFANVVSYSVSVAGWRDPGGELWAPNTTLRLIAPGAMIYAEYEFLVRAVALSRKGDSEGATLSLVLPGAFDGQIPEVMPWQG